MPSIQRMVALAGLASNANVFNGTDYERVPGELPHRLELVCGQLGEEAGDVLATFTVGGRVVVPESGLNVDATNPNAERATLIKTAVGRPGEIILLRLVNTDVAAIVVGVRLTLVPIAGV